MLDVVVCESVWLFTVNGVITDLHLLLGHAQRDAAHIFDEAHDERGPDNIPADDEEGTNDLETDLSRVSLDCSTGIGSTESCTAFNGSEDTGSNTANNGTNKMCVEDLQGVVDMREDRHSAAGDVHCEPWDDTREEAERDGSPACNKTSSRSNGNKTCDHALDGANDRRLAEIDEIHHCK